MLDRDGLRWRDMLNIPAASTPPPAEPEATPDLAEVRDLAARLRDHASPGPLTLREEASFTASLATWRGRITDRQAAILDRLVRKARLDRRAA